MLWTLAPQAWNLGGGPVTIACVATVLTPTQQGFFYAFASVLALRNVLDMGLSSVFAQCVSHEAAFLRVDARRRLAGAADHRSRLIRMTRFALGWYAIAAVALAVLLLVTGLLVFRLRGGSGVSWRSPWVGLVVCESISLGFTPAIALIEGLGYVHWAARVRALQTIVGDVVVWCLLLAGAALWAPVGEAMLAVGIVAIALVRSWRPLLAEVAVDAPSNSFSWRAEIWPFQWRSALSTVGGYLALQAFTPLLFVLQGPVTAGRLGLSMTVGIAILSASMAWLQTKRPTFGMLVARRDFDMLDRQFFPAMLRSFALVVAGTGLLIATVIVLGHMDVALAHRFLSPWATAGLCIGIICTQVQWAQSAYLRAHKREMFMTLRLVCAVLTLGLSLVLGRAFGAAGMMLAFAAVSSTVSLGGGTLLFVRLRKLWHQPAIRASRQDASVLADG